MIFGPIGRALIRTGNRAAREVVTAHRYAKAQRNQQKLIEKTQEVAEAVTSLEQRLETHQQESGTLCSTRGTQLAPEIIALIEKACACPSELMRGEGEARFIAETTARLRKFGDRIRLSEKQLAWLRKIAKRMDVARRSGPAEGVDKN